MYLENLFNNIYRQLFTYFNVRNPFSCKTLTIIYMYIMIQNKVCSYKKVHGEG